MDHQSLLNEVKKEFIELVMNIEASSAMSLFDVHRIAEKIMLPLFRIIKGWEELQNLNANDKENFPAIDLADNLARVAIQVTGTSSLEKVKRTLEKFLKHKLNDSYDRVIIYVLARKQSTYSQKSIDKVVQKSVVFSAVNDILDYTDLLKDIAKLSPDKVVMVLEVLRSYRLGNDPAQHPGWLVKTEKSLGHVQAFTPRWLFFAERKIPLIGREAELLALRKFMNDSASFYWWAICGPAGIGKTRLAHELELEYREKWYCGFVRADDIKLADQLLALKRPTLIIVDYAAREVKELSSLFKICCSLAKKTSIKLRLLLLEREAGGNADWWSGLLESSGVLSNQIRNRQYNSPLTLPSLGLQSEEILRAWINEGAPEMLNKLPPTKSEFWGEVKEVSQGRPLVIALVAAAFSRAPSMTLVPTLPDLMRPILNKEVLRWRATSTDEQSFVWLVQLLALAAFIRGIPVLQPEDRVVIKAGDEGKILLLKDQETQQMRIPKFKELGEYTEILKHLVNHQKELWNTLTLLVPDNQLNSTVKLAFVNCPPNAALQPDLIAEFFIDELWRPRLPFETNAPLPHLSDEVLGFVVSTAWRISPFRLIETLEALKKTTTCMGGYLRVITMLTEAVCATHTASEHSISILARLLYNATIRIGVEKTNLEKSQQVFGLLSNLMEKYPYSKSIAYRHLKAIIHINNLLQDETRKIEYAKIVSEKAMQLVELVKSNPQDQVELHWGDSLTNLSQAGIQANSKELVLVALASAQHLQDNFYKSQQVMTLLAKQYAEIAQHVAEIHGDNYSLSYEIAPLAEAIITTLQMQVVKAINHSHAQVLRVRLTWALINIMFASAKLKQADNVIAIHREVAKSISKISDADIVARMRVKSEFNVQTSYIQKGEIEKLYQSVDKLKVDFDSNYSDEAAASYLGILERALKIGSLTNSKNFLTNFNRLLSVYPHLSDNASVINALSQALAAIRSNALFYSDEYLAALARLLPPPSRQERLCAVLYQANYFAIQASYVKEGEAFLDCFDKLVGIVREHPNFDEAIHCLDYAAIQYWLDKGKQESESISDSCLVKSEGENTVVVRVTCSGGSVLSESIITLSNLLPVASSFP